MIRTDIIKDLTHLLSALVTQEYGLPVHQNLPLGLFLNINRKKENNNNLLSSSSVDYEDKFRFALKCAPSSVCTCSWRARRELPPVGMYTSTTHRPPVYHTRMHVYTCIGAGWKFMGHIVQDIHVHVYTNVCRIFSYCNMYSTKGDGV